MSIPEMPAADVYKAGGGEPETIRDKFVARYGQATVSQAELQVCLDLFILLGVIKPGEFLEILERKLQRVENLRKIQAGYRE